MIVSIPLRKGHLHSLTDAKNNVTSYQYDDAGRQTQVIYGFGTPEAKTWSYSYLATNQVETVTKPDGTTATHGYDNRGRLVSKTYSDAANADTFSYYGNSLLKTAVSGLYGTTVDRTAGQAYDEAGRLLAEVQDNNGTSKTVSYAYTQDSLLDTITYPSGRVLHQTYTAQRELDGVQLDGGAVASHVYDNAGRLTQRNYGNGKVANWTLDANSRMTEVDHVGVQKYGYTYSDEGDPLTQTDLTTLVNNEGYTYDGMHRLSTMNRGPQGMPDFSQSWSLDQVGNWTSWNDNGQQETRTHNALNQLTQKGAATCVYDGKGNQVDDGERFTMVYDPNNRLKEVRDRATQETVVTCKYDALGRRVERNVLKPVEYQTGGITRYYYAGQRIVEEYDGTDLLQAVYTYGQYIDEPLSMDHIPTSQPTSQPASQPAAGGTGILPVTENTPTATPEVMVSPTATAAVVVSPQPSVIGQTPVATATPLSLQGEVGVPGTPGEGAPTPTVLPLQTAPPDPYATIAAEMLTPVPTDTPVALQTSPPDPYATQAAQMVESSTPLPEPTVAQVQSIPQVITSPTPLATPVQALATTSQPTLERYYYHTNRLYSVAALTNSQGNVVERYQYNAYGLCTTFDANYELPMTFSRFGNPFTFTGRELDPETDLMYYRGRTYGLRDGRFKQQDPIGYLGGINLYEYVNSSPISSLDPFGNLSINLGFTTINIPIPQVPEICYGYNIDVVGFTIQNFSKKQIKVTMGHWSQTNWLGQQAPGAVWIQTSVADVAGETLGWKDINPNAFTNEVAIQFNAEIAKQRQNGQLPIKYDKPCSNGCPCKKIINQSFDHSRRVSHQTQYLWVSLGNLLVDVGHASAPFKNANVQVDFDIFAQLKIDVYAGLCIP